MERDDIIRGMALRNMRKRAARRAETCGTCGAACTAESVGRCLDRAPKGRSTGGYHIRSTAEQRAVRAGAHAAVAVYYAGRTVREIEDILAEEED